ASCIAINFESGPPFSGRLFSFLPREAAHKKAHRYLRCAKPCVTCLTGIQRGLSPLCFQSVFCQDMRLTKYTLQGGKSAPELILRERTALPWGIPRGGRGRRPRRRQESPLVNCACAYPIISRTAASRASSR